MKVVVKQTIEVDPDRLRELREWSGIGSRQLSRDLGRSHGFISKLERNEIEELDADLFDKILDAVEGKRDLEGIERADLVRHAAGQIRLGRSLVRPLEAPQEAGADLADSTAFMPLAILGLSGGPREETPAEAGVSERRGGPLKGGHAQMS